MSYTEEDFHEDIIIDYDEGEVVNENVDMVEVRSANSSVMDMDYDYEKVRCFRFTQI